MLATADLLYPSPRAAWARLYREHRRARRDLVDFTPDELARDWLRRALLLEMAIWRQWWALEQMRRAALGLDVD